MLGFAQSLPRCFLSAVSVFLQQHGTLAILLIISVQYTWLMALFNSLLFGMHHQVCCAAWLGLYLVACNGR